MRINREGEIFIEVYLVDFMDLKLPFNQGWQFCLTPLNLPLPTSPRVSFPYPAKVVGQGWGKILAPHYGTGWGWVQTLQTYPAPPHPSLPRPAPPLPVPTLPCPALLRVIIVNFSNPKNILFKQTYQYLAYFILLNVVLCLYFVMCQDICNSMFGTYVTILCNWLIL